MLIPKLQAFPISEVADIGDDMGIPLLMDNTASPVICKPFAHGAHNIVYASTKYFGGHGSSIGGLLVDSGEFDWERHAHRCPMPSEPDPRYHGAIWIKAAKPLGPIA